jgi:hypothetical protein
LRSWSVRSEEAVLTRWLATVESAAMNDIDACGFDEGAASTSDAMSSLSVGGEAQTAGGTTRGEALHDDADDTTSGELLLLPIMMTLLKEAIGGAAAGGGVAAVVSGRRCAAHRPSLVR